MEIGHGIIYGQSFGLLSQGCNYLLGCKLLYLTIKDKTVEKITK